MPSLDESILSLRQQIKAGQVQQVRWPLQKLLNRHPNHPELLSIAAYVEHRSGNTQASVKILRAALQSHPANLQLRQELGFALDEVGDRAAAEEQFREVVERDPRHIEATEKLSQFLMDRGAWAECEPLLKRLIEQHPNRSEAWNRLGWIKIATGELEEAERLLQRSIALNPDNVYPHSNRALLASYRDDLSPAEGFAIYRQWAERFAPREREFSPRTMRKPGRLRVGYVSPDFRAHSVTTFVEPVLANHDRTAWEIFCYSSVAQPDVVTERVRAQVEHWRNIRPLDDRTTANLIREDDIDILVDLAGHTGGNRLRLFALKPAPVQITWLGYPSTTGMTQMGYRFTDSIADPTDASQQWHTEKLIRLPGTFFCYGGTDPEVPDIVETPPSVRTGKITFAVPTNMSKIRPAMIALWATILHRLPEARLTIKAIGADVPSAREWVLRELDTHKIDPARFDLLGRTSTHDYFNMHNQWDVALDTFPFNGHTTTCHCLWMGVPIVTRAGELHAGRMGASVLHSLGLDDLIANSPEEYVEIAARIAADVDRRRELRRTLRDRMRSSPMMDGPTFTRAVEDVFRKLIAAVR